MLVNHIGWYRIISIFRGEMADRLGGKGRLPTRGRTELPPQIRAAPLFTGTCTALPGACTAIPDTRTAFPDACAAFPGARTAFPGACTAFPDTYMVILGACTAFPIARTIFPDACMVIPGARTTFPDACMVIPGARTAFPGAYYCPPGAIFTFLMAAPWGMMCVAHNNAECLFKKQLSFYTQKEALLPISWRASFSTRSVRPSSDSCKNR